MSGCYGLRTFMFALLQLIKKGCSETCDFVEKNMGEGIASVLNEKYAETFAEVNFTQAQAESVDKYYCDNWLRCINDEELRKYCCEENEGIYLLIAVALNEIG